MPRAPEFPLILRDQGTTVKIYRVLAKSTKSGFAFKVSWIGAEGVAHQSFADLNQAKDFARTKAGQLAAGVASGLQLSRADWIELGEIRDLARQGGSTPLAAMQEWMRARQLAGPGLIEACSLYAARQPESLSRITVARAVDSFIQSKDEAGKEGARVYGSKLKSFRERFGELHLDALSVQDWGKFLRRFEDPVTRNDIRKRLVTLCRWAQRHGHLPDSIRPEVEKTERAKERAKPIGILTPGEYRRLLAYFREKHPKYLAALVIAGFCGVRAEEIHGKRSNPELRQSWEDVHLEREFLAVTAAKENTPSSRIVPLGSAALAWLKICPNHQGPICQPHAIDRIRKIAAENNMTMPPNSLRHSYITYRIALTGDKAGTATESGNSVTEIDRRYRVPRPKADGVAWFGIMPD